MEPDYMKMANTGLRNFDYAKKVSEKGVDLEEYIVGLEEKIASINERPQQEVFAVMEQKVKGDPDVTSASDRKVKAWKAGIEKFLMQNDSEYADACKMYVKAVNDAYIKKEQTSAAPPVTN